MRDWSPILGLPLWVWLFVLPSLLAGGCLIAGPRLARPLAPLWRLLDGVYRAAGVVAAAFLLLILLLIVGQMVARWSALTFPGATEYAGYAMAATSFFALSYTLTQGAHIRVSLFLRGRVWLDALAMWVAALVATYFARYAIKTNVLSKLINDRTQGQDYVPESLLTTVRMLGTWPWDWPALWASAGSGWVYTPIWLPQLPMSVGTVLLAVALWDYLCRLLVQRQTAITGEMVE